MKKTVYVLRDSDDDVLHSELLRFWTSSIFGILNSTKRSVLKVDLFPSSGDANKAPTLLGPLERANLIHWSSDWG
jgi:hypothetical protein